MRTLAALALVLAAPVFAMEKAAPAVPACVCVEATNGARDTEPLAARITRLETALRLSKAERVVRKGRK